MASTSGHDVSEDILVNQALIDSNLVVLSDTSKQLSKQGINYSFGVEDAINACVLAHYDQHGFDITPLPYLSVYGPTGKAIYSFDSCFEAIKDNVKLLLLGEVKSCLQRPDVEQLVRNVFKLKQRFNKVQDGSMPAEGKTNYLNQIALARLLLQHKIVPFVGGWRIMPDALSKARDAECSVVAVSGTQYKVYGANEIDSCPQARLNPEWAEAAEDEQV